MNLKDIKLIEPGFYYYQSDMFANIRVSFRFNIKNTKENYIKSIILCDYLNKTNGKYKTLKEINDKCRNLYASDYTISHSNTGNSYFIKFTFKMIDPKIIGDDYFKDAIDFFKEIMFNPNFQDGKLDTNIFEKIKQDLYDEEKEMNYEPRVMQYRYFLKSIIPDSEIVKNNIEDLTDMINVLSKINEQDIIDFYYEVINSFSRAWCFGNLTDKEIKYIYNTFNFKTSNFKKKYFLKEKVASGEKEVVSKETSQSYLYVVYDIKDYKFEENYIYSAILNMLNSSMTGLVLRVLREELGLVYSANAQFYNFRGFMYIRANIDKKNKDKCLKGIDEIFKRLHDEKEIEKLLTYYKDMVKQVTYTNKENFSYYIDSIMDYVYEEAIPETKEVELINKLTTSDIIKYVNKLEKKFIFFYRGDK